MGDFIIKMLSTVNFCAQLGVYDFFFFSLYLLSIRLTVFHTLLHFLSSSFCGIINIIYITYEQFAMQHQTIFCLYKVFVCRATFTETYSGIFVARPHYLKKMKMSIVLSLTLEYLCKKN